MLGLYGKLDIRNGGKGHLVKGVRKALGVIWDSCLVTSGSVLGMFVCFGRPTAVSKSIQIMSAARFSSWQDAGPNPYGWTAWN
jgi:hypothetical protein